MAQGYRGLEPEAVPYGLHPVYPRALSVNTAHTRFFFFCAVDPELKKATL